MSLPKTLDNLVKALGDDFEPTATRKEYDDRVETWQLYLDLFELDATLLKAMIVRHGDLKTDGDTAETDARYQLRQKLAAVFNYVPTVIRMTINYLFAERPEIVATEPRLSAFIGDCDGRGTPLDTFIRQQALPLALVFGFLDVLTQNPPPPIDAQGDTAPRSLADVNALNLSPRVMSITPLQRINWSARPDGSYNWISFVDKASENENPLISDPERGDAYFRVSSAFTMPEGNDWSFPPGPINDEAGNNTGFFVKSWLDADNKWQHDGEFIPTPDVPVSTLYYVKSLDHKRRHFGLSKIAQIAICTFKIIQLLSWTDEEVLANIGIFVMPGNPPKDPSDPTKNARFNINPFSILWVGDDAKIPADRLVGDVSNIKVKMEIVDAYVGEILRLAFIIGASAEAEIVTSGVQGVVSRNELFMELTDLAGALDRFTLDILAKAQTWINGAPAEGGEAAGLKAAGARASFYKGPYSLDPLNVIIDNTTKLEALFLDLSPTLVKNVYKQCAASAMYNEDTDRAKVFEEIEAGLGAKIAEIHAQRDALAASLADVGAANDGTTTNTTAATDTTAAANATESGAVDTGGAG